MMQALFDFISYLFLGTNFVQHATCNIFDFSFLHVTFLLYYIYKTFPRKNEKSKCCVLHVARCFFFNLIGVSGVPLL